MGKPWIGIDLDKTWAVYQSGQMKRDKTAIGTPLQPMTELVQSFRASGYVVKIFTARATAGAEVVAAIKKWCKDIIGVELEVTNVKDVDCILIIDDKAVQAIPNTGMILGDIQMALRGS